MNCSINDHRETRLIVMCLIFPSFFHHTYIHFTFLLIQQSRRNLISYLTSYYHPLHMDIFQYTMFVIYIINSYF